MYHPVHIFANVWITNLFSDPLEGDLFEGDISGIKLTSIKAGEEETLDIKNAVKDTYKLWPNNEIPYVISNAFGTQERSVIRAATEQFSKHSCVKWRPHVPTDRDYVYILRDQGCYSRVGRTGKAQILSLGKKSIFKFPWIIYPIV